MTKKIEANRRRLKLFSIGHMYEDTFGKEQADRFAQTDEGKRYFLPPEKQRIVDNLNREELGQAEEDYTDEALNYLRDLIEKGDVTSYEDAIDNVMILLIGDLNDRFGIGAAESKSQIKNKILRWFSNPKNVRNHVPEISHLEGRGVPKKGIIDKERNDERFRADEKMNKDNQTDQKLFQAIQFFRIIADVKPVTPLKNLVDAKVIEKVIYISEFFIIAGCPDLAFLSFFL